MNSAGGDFSLAATTVGMRFGPVSYPVSESANDRYWDAAGIDHPARAARVLYPPMAANLTILAFQTLLPRPLLHTAQRLETHRVVHAPAELTVSGEITARFAKRGREYVEVTVSVTTGDTSDPLWTSIATFVEAGA